MDAGFLKEITQFVRFSPSDCEALRAFHLTAKPHFQAIVERFYEQIQQTPGAMTALRNDAQITRLKGTLVNWLDELLLGPWDDSYCEKRARIGQMHVKVGLKQRYMSAGMAIIRDGLHAIADEAHADDPRQRRTTLRAINRVLDLDLTIMLESYRDDSLDVVRRVQHMEHELLERKLRVSEARYESVIENAEVLIIAVSRGGEVVMFNQKAETVTEYARMDLAGKRLFETLCNQEDDAQMHKAIDRALDGELVAPFEGKVVSRRGLEHWIRWHVTPMAASEDQIACAIGIDVTDERNLHRRTQQAEKLATLGALAAGLAHEIRNPLNSAQLQLMLVERRVNRLPDRATGASALKAATIVREELQRLAGLVEDFLAFARPRALRVISSDLCETVNTVVGLLKPEAAGVSVALNVNCEHTTIALFDEERIKQVVLNLVRNAVQAVGQNGSVWIEVKRDASRAVVAIRDDGPGVPEGIDIFEPFATTKTSGTGLGLPIVKRIVEDHGGDISVGRENDLTVFRLELPLEGPRL